MSIEDLRNEGHTYNGAEENASTRVYVIFHNSDIDGYLEYMDVDTDIDVHSTYVDVHI